MRPFEHEDLSAPGRTAFGPGSQRIHDFRRHPSRDCAWPDGDLQTHANAAIAFAHIQKHGETHSVALAEPQPAHQAADRLRFANPHVLVLRGTGDDSIPGLGQVGQAEREILIAQARAVEAALRRPREQLVQSPLQVRPHPVRKVPARDDELVHRQRRKVRGEQAIESDDLCVCDSWPTTNKSGESTATRNPRPAPCNRQPPGPFSNHSTIGPGLASKAVGPY